MYFKKFILKILFQNSHPKKHSSETQKTPFQKPLRIGNPEVTVT